MTAVGNAVVALLALVGGLAVFFNVQHWWRLSTRGEFRCPTCGSVTPLPKDDGV